MRSSAWPRSILAMRFDPVGTSFRFTEQARGEPVVLLHCSGSSGAQWRSLGAKLGARYRVIAPDLIGYGASAPWSAPLSTMGDFCLAREAAAVRSILGRLGEPAHLVGHSYGGAVALHLARTRPELLHSLTLIEPSAFHLLRGGDATDIAALREIMDIAGQMNAAHSGGDLMHGIGLFMDYWNGPGTWDAMPADKREAFVPQLPKVMLDFHALFNEPAELEDLREVALPTLLVQGACTRMPSRLICERLRETLPALRFRLVQGAGHMLPLTHRDAVNELVAAHLDANAVQPGRTTCKPYKQPIAMQSA